mgnify:CR=1 FL=1
MMSARARVLSNYTVDALRIWAVEVDAANLAKATPAQQAASLYGATLAAIKLRDYKEAQTQWTRLSNSVRGDPVAARLARLLGVELKLKGIVMRGVPMSTTWYLAPTALARRWITCAHWG